MDIKNIHLQKTKRAGRAFTLIELLVVIAIMGIVAALIANLAAKAKKTRTINRVRVELEALDTVIESYGAKRGFFPPSNADPNNPVTNQLFYELTGTFLNTNNNSFETINGSERILDSDVKTFFGVESFANSSTDRAEVKNFFSTMKPSQFAELSATPEVKVLVVPVEGPNDIVLANGKKLNTWRYNSRTPTHNPDSYDLWAEIVIGGETNIIGNWKD